VGLEAICHGESKPEGGTWILSVIRPAHGRGEPAADGGFRHKAPGGGGRRLISPWFGFGGNCDFFSGGSPSRRIVFSGGEIGCVDPGRGLPLEKVCAYRQWAWGFAKWKRLSAKQGRKNPYFVTAFFDPGRDLEGNCL